MGTHPIFESDFDCLTDMELVDLIKHPKVENVRLLDSNCRISSQGILMTTPHHFTYLSNSEEIQILHKSVDLAEKDFDRGRIQARIRLKSGRVIQLVLSTETEVDAVVHSIQLLSMIETKLCYPFSFIAPQQFEDLDEIVINNTQQWFKTLRQKRWRLYDGNKNFAVCKSYPQYLVVPESIKDDVIMKASKFRDDSRFPVLSCVAGNTNNPLMRSSSMGYVEQRNTYDEDILKKISNGQKGLIIDIRPGAMIKELKSKKKGLETDYSYPLFRKEYPALPNRYTVHESFIKCWEAVESKADDFLDKLRKSGWLSIVDSILSTSSAAAQGLLQAPILIHGGEGKDITLVITSVVQVILLPECRTIRGFLSVIQREWIDAGHPFSDRYRNGPWSPKNQKTSSDGSSFFLFLHSINHLIATYPSHFQFNSSLLLKLHDECIASEYGTFLCNSEAERMQLKTKSKTYSIWKLFQMKEFTNPLYEAPIPQPAWPLGPCDLWRDYWCRYQNNKNTKSTSQLEIQAVQQLVSRNQELREKMQQLANQRR